MTNFIIKQKSKRLIFSEALKEAGLQNENDFTDSILSKKEILEDLLPRFDIEYSEDLEIQTRATVNFGAKTSYYPDFLLKKDGKVICYIEVMDQTNGGRWDDYHHQQLILKKTTLGRDVIGIGLGFGDFHPNHIREMNNIDNCFAVECQLDKNQKGDIECNFVVHNKIKWTEREDNSPVSKDYRNLEYLVGQVFKRTHRDTPELDFEIEVISPSRYLVNGEAEYSSLNQAVNKNHLSQIPCDAWNGIKNSEGLSPNEVCKKMHSEKSE